MTKNELLEKIEILSRIISHAKSDKETIEIMVYDHRRETYVSVRDMRIERLGWHGKTAVIAIEPEVED